MSSATRIPRPFRQPDSRASRRLDSNISRTLPCRISWARNHLQRALGEGPVFGLNPQRHFPSEVKVSPGLRLGVADLVVGLEQQRRRQ